MPPGGSAWTGPSLTCTADGLDHLVSADAAAHGIAARQGTYTAICGHLVYVAPLVSSPGPLCSRWPSRSHRSRHRLPGHRAGEGNANVPDCGVYSGCAELRGPRRTIRHGN